MVTDKNWFKENILCLLSNAVKYSHGGKVTLTITHVAGNLQIQVPWEDVKVEKQTTDYSILNTEYLPSGIYFIKAIDKNGNVLKGKFEKQ